MEMNQDELIASAITQLRDLSSRVSAMQQSYAELGFRCARRIVELEKHVCPVHGENTAIEIKLERDPDPNNPSTRMTFHACCETMKQEVLDSLAPYVGSQQGPMGL